MDSVWYCCRIEKMLCIEWF